MPSQPIGTQKIKKIGKKFNDNFVGLQITDASAVFTLGNFTVEANLKQNNPKDYSGYLEDVNQEGFTLEDIDNTVPVADKPAKSQIKLNIDKSNLGSYAYYGSLKEIIKGSIIEAILKWPGSLYVSAKNSVIKTALNYTYNAQTNISRFEVPVSAITNQFDIDFTKSSAPTNKHLPKNLTQQFMNYVVYVPSSRDEFKIKNLTGNTATHNYLLVECEGEVFPGASSIEVPYHIKPAKRVFMEFLNEIDDFQSFMFQKHKAGEGFEFTFSVPTENNDGELIYTQQKFLWPTSDGYNIDIQNSSFDAFFSDLMGLGDLYDENWSDLIANRYSAGSLIEFDNTDDGKMTKLLRVYGRLFDEIKYYIDGLATIHAQNYQKRNSYPDKMTMTIAESNGWEPVRLISNDESLKAFDHIPYTRTTAEVEDDIWDMININTPYFSSSKGTRKSVEDFFSMIGIIPGLVEFNEHVYIAEQPRMSITIEKTNITCYNASNGKLYVSVTGGVPPYTYNWNNGLATTSQIENLGTGTYTVTVKDSNNEEITAYETITQPNPIIGTLTIYDATSPGSQDGSILSTISGGTPPYTYDWSNGEKTKNLQNIGAGSYKLTVTDANGCQASWTRTVQQPECNLSIHLVKKENTCGGNNGEAEVLSITGGSGNYSYLWNTGATTSKITDIPSGTYSVTVTDNVSSCQANGSITLDEFETMHVTVSKTDIMCSSENTGSATANVTGGNPPYTYQWNTGATTQTINNLPQGSYSVTVYDTNGCSLVSSAITINRFTRPSVSVINATTNSLEASATGGTPPYTYKWSNNQTTKVAIGLAHNTTYSVTVTDSKGCTNSASGKTQAIAPPPPPSAPEPIGARRYTVGSPPYNLLDIEFMHDGANTTRYTTRNTNGDTNTNIIPNQIGPNHWVITRPYGDIAPPITGWSIRAEGPGGNSAYINVPPIY